MGDPLTRVEFTHLSKILYPEAGITKLEVIKYFIRIAPKILPSLREGPSSSPGTRTGQDPRGSTRRTPPWGRLTGWRPTRITRRQRTG